MPPGEQSVKGDQSTLYVWLSEIEDIISKNRDLGITVDANTIVQSNLIYKVRTGSHAYGTNISTSDEDYAGIFIPPEEYFFGLQALDMLSEQSEDDRSYYSLRKYANLAIANNPNVLELLFVDDRDVLLQTESSALLRENRHLFLSKRCQKTFVGYANAQLHRIRTHTKWLSQELEDMKLLWPYIFNEQVTHSWVGWRFGENMLKRVAQEFDKELQTNSRLGIQSDLLHAAKHHFYYGTSMGNESTILQAFRNSYILCPEKNDPRFKTSELMGGIPVYSFQKHLYDEAKKKRDQYVTWMAERNPERHKTELVHGYDTKHAMHLVRLLRSGYEILSEGTLNVRRSDASDLLSIRAGDWSYERIVAYADEMVAKINSISTSRVPDLPETDRINRLVVRITREWLSKNVANHVLLSEKS